MPAASASFGYVEPHRGLHHERAATMPNLLDEPTPAIENIVAPPIYLTKGQISTSSFSYISFNIPCSDDHAAEVPHRVGKYCVKHADQVPPFHPSSPLPRYMVLRLPSEQSASRAPCYHSEPPTNALGDMRRALALPYQPSNRPGNVRGTLFGHAKNPRYHMYGSHTICIY